jgi:phosphatidylglycerophosphate synthase
MHLSSTKLFFTVSPSADELRHRLARWSFAHALLMLWATAITWSLAAPWALSFFGAFSFSLLILAARPRWTEKGVFGSANAVTAFRLVGVLVLPLFGTSIDPLLIAGIGSVLLAADGLDGWLARRCNQASEFGEYFDKETDALLLLVVCTLATLTKRLWPWILALGVLRYVFVITIHCFGSNLLKEERSARARMTCGLVMVVMIGSFLPYPMVYRSLAVMASAVLLLSFVIDFYRGLSRN